MAGKRWFSFGRKQPALASSYQEVFPNIWVADNLRRWLEIPLSDIDEADWNAIRKIMETAATRLEDGLDAE